MGSPTHRARQPRPYDCVLSHRDTPSGSLVGGGVVPTGAGDGDCPCVAGDEDEGTSSGDGDISGIARSADQFELSVIREDDHSDVAADPLEREQVADAG